MDQHRRSPLSQATLQCSPGYPWDFITVGDPGVSTQLRGILVPDTSIVPENGWNGPPFPSMKHQDENGLYHPTVGKTDTTINTYNPLLGPSPDHYPTLSPSDEVHTTCVLRILSNLVTLPGLGYQISVDNTHQQPIMNLCSLQDVFSGPQTRVDVPNDHFAVQLDAMADRTLRDLFPRFDTNSSQTYLPLTDDQMMTELWAATDIVANLGDHERSKTQISMMPFGAKSLLPGDRSCSPTSFTCSTGSSMRLRTMSQETNQAAWTHNEGEHLSEASSPEPPSQLFRPQDRGMRVKKKQYQCDSCYVSFVQRQGLTRHSKDKHKPKKRCGFCVDFTWPQGRRYIYRRHLREEHPGVVSPTPIACRGVD
ncbi:hypothetical protein EDB86DRAFT_1070649 [Lactarius hatsudake]|nr:hypothetical protein EDB86DRAFT_1070649 [Lactarius hatsudake]